MDNLNVKGLILMMVCISIMLNFAGFQLIKFDTGEDILTEFFDFGNETNPQDITINNDTKEMVEQMTQPSEGFLAGAVGSIIDVLKLIGVFLTLLANILFTPLAIVLAIPGLPYVVAMMIGVPISIAYIIAIVYFIRGLN